MTLHLKALFTVCLLVLASSDVASQEKIVEYGHYLCVTDRAVGFQPDGTGRYAGEIQMSPDHQKFFAEILKITQGQRNVFAEDMSKNYLLHDHAFCSQTFENLEKEWKAGDTGKSPVNEMFFSSCLAKSVLVINIIQLGIIYL